MDLFTQHYSQYQRAGHEYEVDIANAIGPHLAAARGRTRAWHRLGAWMRAAAGQRDRGGAKEALSYRRPVAGEPLVDRIPAPP